MMYKVEKIEIIENKVFCTIYNKYEKFNSVPIEKLKLVRKNGKLYAKLKFDEEKKQKEKRNRNDITAMRKIKDKNRKLKNKAFSPFLSFYLSPFIFSLLSIFISNLGEKGHKK